MKYSVICQAKLDTILKEVWYLELFSVILSSNYIPNNCWNIASFAKLSLKVFDFQCCEQSIFIHGWLLKSVWKDQLEACVTYSYMSNALTLFDNPEAWLSWSTESFWSILEIKFLWVLHYVGRQSIVTLFSQVPYSSYDIPLYSYFLKSKISFHCMDYMNFPFLKEISPKLMLYDLSYWIVYAIKYLIAPTMDRLLLIYY